MKKEEQIKPHMNGFLNTGGTKEELANLLGYLALTLGTNVTQNGIETLCNILLERNENQLTIKNINEIYERCIKNTSLESSRIDLSKKDLHLASVASAFAIGDQIISKERIGHFLDDSGLNQTDVRNVLIHLIAYCGFPVAVNGFTALKTVLEKRRVR